VKKSRPTTSEGKTGCFLVNISQKGKKTIRRGWRFAGDTGGGKKINEKKGGNPS